MFFVEPPEAYGYTIFCDDIRAEIGGKLTYVGAYPSNMVVHGTFPFVLPKFAIHFVYRQRQPDVVMPTKIIIATPGNTEENPEMSIDVGFESDEIEATARAKFSDHGDDPKYMLIQGPITLTNFVIREPGLIRVRATRGEKFVRLGTLRVEQDKKFIPTEKKK
jgi:hypothetical protein